MFCAEHCDSGMVDVRHKSSESASNRQVGGVREEKTKATETESEGQRGGGGGGGGGGREGGTGQMSEGNMTVTRRQTGEVVEGPREREQVNKEVEEKRGGASIAFY